MPTFDAMLSAVRTDCDTTHLAGSAELRRLGHRRTNRHRAIGGAAALVVVGGLATGVAVYGAGTSAAVQAGTSTSPTVAVPVAAPSTSPAGRAPIVAPPSASPQATTRKPSVQPGRTSSSTATHAASDACVAADFDVAHARIQQDDASGITGFDIVIKYDGATACKLSQAPTLSYLNGSGTRIVIPLSFSAKAVMVKPHTSISTSVSGPNDQAVFPTPPECAQPHVYAGLDARIDGQSRSLGSRSVTLPCGGAKTLPWSIG